MPIPKIIHQTYKHADPLPPVFAMCQSEIKRLHPDFEYRFYTDRDIDEFIKCEFPEYYADFKQLPRMIMKIDMFRYFLMYKYGGIYADMDYLMLQPFDLLDHTVVLPCNREDMSGIPTCLGNCVFASEPAHPFWKTLMDSLFTIDRSEQNYNVDKNVDGSVFGTGPAFVYHMWMKYSSPRDIYVPPRSMFHPETRHDTLYIQSLKKRGTYGMHICTGLWRQNQL
jgi:inositol phosphorylceramide mannosyltransferase catalytic subunit